jgi:hypothetical protein
MGKGTKKDPIMLDNTGPSNSHAPGYWDNTVENQAFEKVRACVLGRWGAGDAGVDKVLSSRGLP